MTTGIWKVVLKEGKRDEFMNSYDLFKQAEGFISCQFYPVKDDANTLLAVESWISEDAHKQFMGTLAPEAMGKLFGMLDGQPEMYNCDLGIKIEK